MMKKMIMAIGCILCAAQLMAETETVGDYTWTYRINGGTAEICSGNGYAAISPKPDGAVVIPSTLGGKPVTTIGEWAFYGCDGLTGVTIPSGVTAIGYAAFACCAGLKSVTIPSGVTSIGDSAFELCNGLTGVTIPSGVKTIGIDAFSRCRNLPSVTIPSSVSGIGGGAFQQCYSLTRVTFKGNAPDIGSGAFDSVDAVCTAYVERGSTGWGVKIPGTWQGIRIAYTDGGGAQPGQASGYTVLNAKDITAPYAAPKAAVLKGAAYDEKGAVAGIVELKLGKVSKGASKVSGSFTGLDGKKISIKAVNVTGVDGTAPVTVSLEVKGHGTMTVTIGGDKFAGSLGGWHVQSGAVGGNWTKGTATVAVNAGDVSMFAGTVLSKLLPNGEQAKANGGKWSFDKAAGVKWAKPKKGAEQPEVFDPESGKGLIVDTSKGGNLSAMKLSYTPKKGTFKGSFKVYALEGAGKATKLKKYTFKVSGVVVNGVGHGTATCKKPAANWAVTVK